MFLPRYPLHVVFIITNRCNLRCTHCSSAAGKAEAGELTRTEIEHTLDELSELGVVDLAFSGGEPLLHPHLPDFIAHARARGMRVGTSTNGAPLTPSRTRRLQEAGLSRLQVSLDGPEPVHDRIRGKGSFRRALTAIQRGVDAGLRLHVCFTAMADNHQHLGEVIDLVAALGVHGFNLSQFVPVGRGSIADDLSPQEAMRLLEVWKERRERHPRLDFYSHLAGLTLVDPRASAAPGFIGCQAGVHLACITAVGEVTPCVMFPLVIGSVRERAFREIWDTSPVIKDLRARVLKGACGTCRHRAGCGGCRAAAYVYTGDYRSDDPRCWLLHPQPTAVSTQAPDTCEEEECRTSSCPARA
jgi:AdoMet-dependent heme synthase